MILEDNFRQGFYNTIKQGDKTVVLIVSVDTDALCTTEILTHLLRCDDIPFSIRIVDGWEAVDKIFAESQEQKCYYVLINCGATRSLYQVPASSVAFVIDSHRPFHIENMYMNDQVHLLVNSSELPQLELPDPSAVIDPDDEDDDDGDRDSDDDDDEDEDGGHVSYEGRMEKIRRRAIRREEKLVWQRQRRNILWRYYESTWYSTPSCVLLMELAAEMNRMAAEHMWFTAVGLNSAYVDKLISIEAYSTICYDRMRPFVPRFAARNIINQGKVDDLLHIVFAKELPLPIYAHWDLYNSMSMSEYFSIKTKNWTQRGDANIRQLLAQLGITLAETQQKFESLSTEQRTLVVEVLEKEMSVTFCTFFGTLGYNGKLSAYDVAMAASMRLEMPRKETLINRFRAGQQILSSSITGVRADRLYLAQTFSSLCQQTLQVLWKAATVAINQSEIIPNGPFYLFSSSRFIDENVLESRHFLYNTVGFMLRAFASMKKGRTGRPLIAMFPLSGERNGWLVVTGVMPIATIYEDNSLKTCIGRAFERVKKMAPTLRIRDDSFNSDVIQLKSEDRTRFIDCLQAVFEGATAT